MTPPSPYRERVVHGATLQSAVPFVTITTLWLAARGSVGCPPPHCREGFRHDSASDPRACFPKPPAQLLAGFQHLELSACALLGAPSFSMMVSKPEHGDPIVAERIHAKASSYLTTEEEIAAQQAEGRRRAEDFRKAVKDIREGNDPSKNEKKDAPKDLERGDQRSKHFQPPTGKNGQTAEDTEDEE